MSAPLNDQNHFPTVTVAAPNSRYLTNRLLAEGKVRGLSLVTVDCGGSVNYEPFATETHSTSWVDGIIIIVKTSEVTDFLISDIEMMLSRHDKLTAINDYLRSSRLYPSEGELSTALVF